jgi:phage baseplate assembly protein W
MKAINYPFTLDALGRINSTSDNNKIYLDKILTLLSTPASQRPMNPTYGTDIFRALYETGQDYEQAIRESVLRAMSIHLPQITVDSITISDTDDSGTSNVEIYFTFPDGTNSEILLNSKNLNPNGTEIGDII